MAWEHRGESPFILVQTHKDGSDAGAPRVMPVPRSVWEPRDVMGMGGNLRMLFDRNGFDADKLYCLICILDHPGRAVQVDPRLTPG
jgi:hypothetical protein